MYQRDVQYHQGCRTSRRIVHSRLFVLWGLLLLFGMVAPFAGAHSSTDETPIRSIRAVRAEPAPPQIDGVLDDAVWQHAPIASGFTQRDPVENVPASEDTAFQIAYDDEALYVGIMCYDSEPDKIVRRLYRRDKISYGETDWVGIRLDSHHDHQTGFGFAITPSGSYGDNMIIDDSWFDGTWDSVWVVRTSINDEGWCAELKIPYHAIRFSPQDEYTWGINLDRSIARKHEYDLWKFVPKDAAGICSQNGHIEGIEGIKPPAHLEVLPYAVAREMLDSQDESDTWDFFSALGTDVRYGVTSNISLNAALNPDFGQVEADPAVLNLSVFETYYQERRPFFIEGTGIFHTPLQLFYSRRIGRQPGRFGLPDDSEEISRPESSTILGAAKITGKTGGKTAFGIMEAVTAEEHVTIRRSGASQEEDHLIEPLTNYFVGRVKQDLLEGNSTVGALLTSVNRRDSGAASTGGIDWNLKWRENAYGFSGQVAGSRTGPSDDRTSGYAGRLGLGKNTGWVLAEADFWAISPEFDANDLGFTRRRDYLGGSTSVSVKRNQPWGPFRNVFANINTQQSWNYDRVRQDNTWYAGGHVTLTNYWSLEVWGMRAGETLNDWKTRGGPLVVDPDWTAFDFGIGSDSRKSISGFAMYTWIPTKEGPQRGAYGRIRFQPMSSLGLSLSSNYNWHRAKAQWVENVDDDGDGVDDHFVFGELNTNRLDIRARANVIFTPKLSIEFYMQSFTAVGTYRDFKELARPESFEFVPYPNVESDPDFHNRSLRSNLVLRWEYRPGSTLFLVWSQSRDGSAQGSEFDPWDSLQSSFSDSGRNVFFAKLNYWLGI